MNLQDLMQQMGGMFGGIKEQMDKMKKSLEDKTVEGSAGGGMVKAIVKGNHLVDKIIVDPEIFKENDKEMLEEMIVAAVNDAQSKVADMMQNELGSMAGSMGLPLDGFFK